MVPRDPPKVEEVTELVDAFFAQLKWAEPDVPTGTGEVTATNGRQTLTPAGNEDPHLGESRAPETASPRMALDSSVLEREG